MIVLVVRNRGTTGGRLMQNGVSVLSEGSLVRITGYGPFRGLRGTIRTVDTISAELEEPFCFYLISLEGAQVREPIWFEYDEVEQVSSPLVASRSSDKLN
jgi:hypothetical protein